MCPDACHVANRHNVANDTVLPTARHRRHISSKEAFLPRCNDAEMGSSNSLHASAKYTAIIMKDILIRF